MTSNGLDPSPAVFAARVCIAEGVDLMRHVAMGPAAGAFPKRQMDLLRAQAIVE